MYCVRKNYLAIILITSLFIFCKETPRIAVVTAGGGEDFWNSVEKGAVQAGKDLKIDVLVRGVKDEGNITGQDLVIQSMLKLGYNGLILAPNSDERKQEVTSLKKMGIPTIYIDRDIGGDRVAIVKTDNFKAGEKAGVEMAKALNYKGKVALFRQAKDVVSTTLREEGFIKGLKDKGLGIYLDVYLGSTEREATMNAFDYLENDSEIAGIFTPNESTSVSVVRALEHLDLGKKVIHIGFDSHKIMINAVNSGKMQGFIIQQPYQMGYEAVKLLNQFMQGSHISPKFDTDILYITKENIKNVTNNK